MVKATVAACTEQGGVGIYIIKYIFPCNTIGLSLYIHNFTLTFTKSSTIIPIDVIEINNIKLLV
jgi:hypothetical protein